jgi:hypothetical protein
MELHPLGIVIVHDKTIPYTSLRASTLIYNVFRNVENFSKLFFLNKINCEGKY